MKTRNLIWSFLALALMMSGATAVAQAATADEQAVIAAEQQWLKAQQTNNMELLAPLLAAKVVYTDTVNEKLFEGKDAVLAAFKSYTYSNADIQQLRVRLFGRTAIATGLFVGTLTSSPGQPRDLRLRYTDTWMKMTNGKWLCVAAQD